MILRLLAIALLALPMLAQTWGTIDPCPPDVVPKRLEMGIRGSKISPPRLTKKVEPESTAEARRAMTGPARVVLSIVIAPDGQPCNIHRYNALGFGLDEAVVRAIQQWRFIPAKQDGQIVAIHATVEVNFTDLGNRVDDDTDQHGRLNGAIDSMRSQDPKTREKALAVIQELSAKKFPAADGLLALYYLGGEYVPQDSKQGLLLAQRANKKDDRFGMYALGYAYEHGLGIDKDEASAFRLYSEAATLGLALAQQRMARAYTDGKHYPIDLQRAERTYRLCASQGSGPCAYELAMLLRAHQAPDYAEVGAWALIAQELGVAEAKPLLEVLPQDSLMKAQTLKTAIIQSKRPL